MIREFCLLIVGLAIFACAEAQSTPAFKVKRINKIAGLLSVDRKKASEIIEALDYNIPQIRLAAIDTSIDIKEKHVLLKRLHDERTTRINSELTSEQIRILRTSSDSVVIVRKKLMEQQMRSRLEKLKTDRERSHKGSTKSKL